MSQLDDVWLLGNHRLVCGLSPAYVDVGVVRWQNVTGEKAILEATGETYEDVVVRRVKEAEDGLVRGALKAEEVMSPDPGAADLQISATGDTEG